MSILIYHPNISRETSDRNHQVWIAVGHLPLGRQRQIISHTSTRYDRKSLDTYIIEVTLRNQIDKVTASFKTAAI